MGGGGQCQVAIFCTKENLQWSGEKEGEGGERERGGEKGRKRERESEGEGKRKELRGEREVYVVCLGRRECIRAYKRES